MFDRIGKTDKFKQAFQQSFVNVLWSFKKLI